MPRPIFLYLLLALAASALAVDPGLLQQSYDAAAVLVWRVAAAVADHVNVPDVARYSPVLAQRLAEARAMAAPRATAPLTERAAHGFPAKVFRATVPPVH
jgi:hypothetical protein